MTHESEANDTSEPIVVECELPQPPALVWRALTEPALLSAWLMPNDMRPEVGARFAFRAAAETDASRIECEVLAAEPPHLLRYSWRVDDDRRRDADRSLDSVVTFVLTETREGGTHLRLVHDGFPIEVLQPIASLADVASNIVDFQRARRRRAPIVAKAGTGGLKCAA